VPTCDDLRVEQAGQAKAQAAPQEQEEFWNFYYHDVESEVITLL
jgi:hypothetical protein